MGKIANKNGIGVKELNHWSQEKNHLQEKTYKKVMVESTLYYESVMYRMYLFWDKINYLRYSSKVSRHKHAKK